MTKNLIAIVRSMLDAGSSVEEIVSTLRDMGIPEEEARRLIILANREILLTLRNDLKEIVRGVLEEERDRFVEDLRNDVRSYLDTQLKIINRNLLKLLREELSKYVEELSRTQERLELLERRVFDVERKIYHWRPSSIRFGKLGVGSLLVGLGLASLVSAVLLPLDLYVKAGFGIVGIILILGGLYLG